MFEQIEASQWFLSSLLLVVGALGWAFAVSLPLLGGVPRLRVALARIARTRRREPLHFRPGVDDAIADLSHLDPVTARVAAQTRALLRDLQHVGDQARGWPSDSIAGRGSTERFEPVNYVTREIWEWVRSVEELPPSVREDLISRGVDPAAVRQALLDEGDFFRRMRTMVDLLSGFDQRFHASASDPYRGLATTPRVPAPLSVAAEGEQRRERYVEVLREMGPGLARIASSYTRSRPERDDLVQDISLALWRALPNFRGDSSLRTYVFRIAHNCGISHSVRRKPLHAVSELEDPSPSLEAAIDTAQRQSLLREAVRELPMTLRQVVTLRLEGLSYAEISEVVGITETNVSVRLTRARKRLRDRLVPHEGGTNPQGEVA